MRQFNRASTSSEPEVGGPETTVEAPEVTPLHGPPSTRRLFWILGLFVVVLGGGYLAVTQFTQILAPTPQPPVRPIRSIAKAPGPPAGRPATLPAAPAKAEPPAGTPAKAPTPPKAAPQGPGPVPAAVAPLGPAKVETKPAGPAQKTAPPAAAKVARAETQATPGSFSLQVGAMINEGNAQKLGQRLEALGYSPVIRKGKAYLRRHVVSTGDFAGRPSAEEAAKRLAAQGIAARVTSSAGRFSVEAGSFTSEDDAIDLARQLQRLSFPPRIHDQAQTATVYQVRVGTFASRAEAQAKGTELKGKGFPYLVVKN